MGNAMHSEGDHPPIRPASQITEVSLEHIDTRLRQFRAGEEVDVCVITTERYVCLIDTLATPTLAAHVMQILETTIEGRQLIVINTHADYDHAWGNSLFTRPPWNHAPIIGHDLTADRLRSAESMQSLHDKQAAEDRFAEVSLVPPTITFSQTLTLDCGDVTLHLFPTPGHTDDHISIWIPELHTMLAGDAAEHPFPLVRTPDGLTRLRSSLRTMMAFGPQWVIPCHGGTTDAELCSRNLDYFSWLEDRLALYTVPTSLPADWPLREDLADVVGIPWQEAVGRAGANPADVPGFYQFFHRSAIAVVLATLRDEQSGARNT